VEAPLGRLLSEHSPVGRSCRLHYLPARIGAGGVACPRGDRGEGPGAVTTVPPTAKLPCSWMTKATMWCWRVVHWVRRSQRRP